MSIARRMRARVALLMRSRGSCNAVDLSWRRRLLQARRRVAPDEVADERCWAAGDAALGLVERGEAALARAGSLGDVNEVGSTRIASNSDRGQESGGAVKVVARLVIAKHQRVSQIEIEQRLRSLVVDESRFLTQSVERRSPLDEPLDVVAIVSRCKRESERSRQWPVVDDRRDLRVVSRGTSG